MKDVVSYSIWINLVLLTTLIIVGEQHRKLGEQNHKLKEEINFLKCQQQYEDPPPPIAISDIMKAAESVEAILPKE